MKTRNNKLNFKKQSIAELNEAELNDVNGGTTINCAILISTLICTVAASVVLASAAVIIGNEVNKQ